VRSKTVRGKVECSQVSAAPLLQEFVREAGRDARLHLRETSDRASWVLASHEAAKTHNLPNTSAIFALTFHQALPYCEDVIWALKPRLLPVLPP
jgi:hypothetical protein